MGPPHSSTGESPWGRRGCKGCKRNLRGGTPSCPQGRPQIRTSPLPKPLSYSFTHPHFSSTGGKTPNTPKPRPKTPLPSSPSKAGPQTQILPHSTHQEEEAPSPHPDPELLSHVPAQLQLVPISTGAPQLLIKPLAQQRGCGDRSYKKQTMGFGLPGREFGSSPSQPPSRDGIAVLENEPSPLMR